MSGYQSKLYTGEIFIGDDTPVDEPNPDIHGRGRVPRDMNEQPFCSMAGAGALPVGFLIEESEWDERITEIEREGTLSQRMLDMGIPSLDQNGTNYCWTNGVVTCLYAWQARNNESFLSLSPASVAAPIKHGSNSGGWGGDALEYIVENGIAETAVWANNQRSGWQALNNSPEVQASRAKHKTTEWYDLPAKSFKALMSCLLRRIPVAIGLNWWGHEVAAIDPVALGGGKYGARIRNSWGDSYGTKGFAVLSQSKATPDDACSPRVQRAA